MMRVCVDTNVMIQAFARGSPLVPLFKAIGSGQIGLALSTSILLEYEEIAFQQGGPQFASKIMTMLKLVSEVHDSVAWANPAFQFRVIAADEDDNKFTDCAITADADFMITHDSHFRPLRNSGYKPQPVTPEDFIARFLDLG